MNAPSYDPWYNAARWADEHRQHPAPSVADLLRERLGFDPAKAPEPEPEDPS